MQNKNDLLIVPVLTEKSSVLVQQNKYVVRVAADINKIEVSKLIESRYGVKVKHVNSVKLPRKTMRRGRIVGVRSLRNKFIVTLCEGHEISEFKSKFS